MQLKRKSAVQSFRHFLMMIKKRLEAVHSTYNAEELSLYARRCRTYRKRKLAVKKLGIVKRRSVELHPSVTGRSIITSNCKSQSKMVSGVAVWRADISSHRNQPVGFYAWIV